MEVKINLDAREINEDSETSFIIPAKADTTEVIGDIKNLIQNKYMPKETKPTTTSVDDIPF